MKMLIQYSILWQPFFLFAIVLGPHYENTGVSLYNTRGSIAFLEEIDQEQPSDDVVDIKEENHAYVNVKITRTSISNLWEYMLENTAHGTFETEFKVWYNCRLWPINMFHVYMRNF